jgi:Zn-dependent M28 family amino/carboxypeptidase
MERITLQAWADQVRIPAAQISRPLAEALLSGSGKSLMEWARAAENLAAPVVLPGANVELTTSVDRHVVQGYNVLGMIEGADPALKEESIILSGHHDHIGVDESGTPFNGADDNLSAVVAVIDQAEAYMEAARAGQRPPRTVIFASFDAEERGLLGAWAYTERPTLPLDKIVAVLNMDLIGRSEEAVADPRDWRFRGLGSQTAEQNRNTINVLGESRHPWLKAEVDRANQPFGVQVKRVLDNNASQLLRRSDHWPFLQRGVPALWFLTGLHRDYHTVYDREERIEYDKMERIARMVHQMSWNLAVKGRAAMAGAATGR